MKVYQRMACLIAAIKSCEHIDDWRDKHQEDLDKLVANRLPSGSGWDLGTTVDMTVSTGDKLVLTGSYHHMDENGGYDGWTEHVVTIRPSLQYGITITISGSNRNDIKDYLLDVFDVCMKEEINT